MLSATNGASRKLGGERDCPRTEDVGGEQLLGRGLDVYVHGGRHVGVEYVSH